MERTTFGELLSVDEVAEILRRSPGSVRWLIHTEAIKSGKVGGRRMVRRNDLQAFIDAAFESAAS
ncbi:helix-turn-helix domain-containing protein [Microbacterium sp. ZW T5_56]|uniref:helix-turn-helix domain-containing protein n=1 Tax=Microbacterium sp. ZW T5_56 TaxID=3378081 RepID=UPI003853EAA6